MQTQNPRTKSARSPMAPGCPVCGSAMNIAKLLNPPATVWQCSKYLDEHPHIPVEQQRGGLPEQGAPPITLGFKCDGSVRYPVGWYPPTDTGVPGAIWIEGLGYRPARTGNVRAYEIGDAYTVFVPPFAAGGVVSSVPSVFYPFALTNKQVKAVYYGPNYGGLLGWSKNVALRAALHEYNARDIAMSEVYHTGRVQSEIPNLSGGSPRIEIEFQKWWKGTGRTAHGHNEYNVCFSAYKAGYYSRKNAEFKASYSRAEGQGPKRVWVFSPDEAKVAHKAFKEAYGITGGLLLPESAFQPSPLAVQADKAKRDAQEKQEWLIRDLKRDVAGHKAEANAAVNVTREAYGYASRLFKACAPQCEPLPDLMGVLTQLDNLIAGYRDKDDTRRLHMFPEEDERSRKVQNLRSASPDDLQAIVSVNGDPPLKIVYTNHRGETGVRSIVPVDVPRYAKADGFHGEAGWVIDAIDTERWVFRTFSFSGFGKNLSQELFDDAAQVIDNFYYGGHPLQI